MDRVWFAVFVVSGSIGVTGCSDDGAKEPPPPASVDGWEIEAAAPALSGSTVSASFTARGEGSRAFGACLVADLHGGKTCSSAADCTTGAVVTLATGAFEYCEPSGDSAQKTCWTRNGADSAWCNKVPPPGRAAGTYDTPAVEAAQAGGKTRWMALACLNAGTYPAFTDGPKPPCASSDPAAEAYRVYHTSPVTEAP